MVSPFVRTLVSDHAFVARSRRSATTARRRQNSKLHARPASHALSPRTREATDSDMLGLQVRFRPAT
jgi:hypothetical protein